MPHALRLSLMIVVFCTLGCQVGPKYKPEDVTPPCEWKHPSNDSAPTPDVDFWWQVFEDPDLDTLEMQAIDNNKNLDVALDRVAEARARVGIVQADLYPQLNLQPQYNNQGILTSIFTGGSDSKKQIKTSPFIREHQQLYTLPLNLSYELDIWGRNRSLYKSALYSYEAQQEAYQTALLILTTDVASFYYQIRALDTLIELFTDTIATRQKAFNINQDRYNYKIGNYLPVSQAGLDLSNVQSLYYDARRQRELAVDALAVLLGVQASCIDIASNPLRDLPPTIPAGIPSDVLINRPDIAEAERRMAAENELIGVAYTSFLPSITLTGALGFSSPDFRQFLTWASRFWQMGANINQMVFDGGRDCATVELAWANFREANDTYQEIVLEAFQEVEDALANLEWLEKEAESTALSVKYARTAYNISMDRFLQGVDFYLQVVDNERQLLDNERAQVGVLEQRYISTIQLIKALGGEISVDCKADD